MGQERQGETPNLPVEPHSERDQTADAAAADQPRCRRNPSRHSFVAEGSRPVRCFPFHCAKITSCPVVFAYWSPEQ